MARCWAFARRTAAADKRLLLLIDEMVKQACMSQKLERADFRFSRKDVRRHTRWSLTQIRIHLDRLQEMEFLLAHRAGGARRFSMNWYSDARSLPVRFEPDGLGVELTGPNGSKRRVTATWRALKPA